LSAGELAELISLHKILAKQVISTLNNSISGTPMAFTLSRQTVSDLRHGGTKCDGLVATNCFLFARERDHQGDDGRDRKPMTGERILQDISRSPMLSKSSASSFDSTTDDPDDCENYTIFVDLAFTPVSLEEFLSRSDETYVPHTPTPSAESENDVFSELSSQLSQCSLSQLDLPDISEGLDVMELSRTKTRARQAAGNDINELADILADVDIMSQT
jgi:hypothetical protein